MFGFYYTWGSFFIVTTIFSLQWVTNKKRALYEKFTEEINPDDEAHDDDHHVAWLNLLVSKYYKTCVPFWANDGIATTNRIIEEKKPKFLLQCRIEDLQLGERAPRVIAARFPKGDLSDDKYEIDVDIVFAPEMSLVVVVQPHEKFTLRTVVDNLSFKGTLRLFFSFNNLFPNFSTVSVSFIEPPLIDCSVRPGNSFLDVIAVPLVYEWIQEIIVSNLKQRMLLPEKLTFPFGPGTIETPRQKKLPITDIALIRSPNEKVPRGYILMERTLSGLLPANFNQGNKAAPLYLCYKREPGAKPITGLSVIFPGKGERAPEGFEVISETEGGSSGSLNFGTNGPEVFLCIKKSNEEPPITALGLFNASEYAPFSERFQLLEFSPSGHKANLNKKLSGADRLYIAYKGGTRSFFGHSRQYVPEKGFLRVGLKEARNIVAADVGGTSDPYCILTIGDSFSKDSIRKGSMVIDKTLTPKWDETFLFSVNVNDMLTVDLFDKDLVGKDDFLGRAQIPLNTLVHGKVHDQWFKFQLISKGEALLSLTALDFGLPAETSMKPIEQVACDKKDVDRIKGMNIDGVFGAVGVVGGAVGAVGGAVVGGVGAVGGAAVGAGAKVGGAAVDAVGAVGGAAVGAVGAVGGKVSGVVGGVGNKLFGSSEAAAARKSAITESRDAILSKQSEAVAYQSKEGYLETVGGKLAKAMVLSTKKFWAVLKENHLNLYKSPKHIKKDAHLSFNLQDSTIAVSEEAKLTLVLRSGKKEHQFKLTTNEELSDWYLAIHNNIEFSQKQQ